MQKHSNCRGCDRERGLLHVLVYGIFNFLLYSLRNVMIWGSRWFLYNCPVVKPGKQNMKVKHFINHSKTFKDISKKIFEVFFTLYSVGFLYEIMPKYIDNILENSSEVKPPNQLIQLAKYDSVNAPVNSWAKNWTSWNAKFIIQCSLYISDSNLIRKIKYNLAQVCHH